MRRMHRQASGFALECASVGLLVVAVVWAATWIGPAYGHDVDAILALVTVAVTAAVVIFAGLAAQLRDLSRVAWIGAAFAVYGMVLMPATTTMVADDPRAAAGLQAAGLVAGVTVLLLLALAVRPRGRAWGGWVIAGAGMLLALVAGEVVALAPGGPVGALRDPVAGLAVLGGWCGVAAVYLLRGMRSGRAPIWRIGIGIAVLAGAHLDRITWGAATSGPDPGWAALRLLGVLVVAFAVGEFWLLAVRGIRADQERQTEALRRALVHLQQAADSGARRDHELRNGLGGLTGIAALLGSGEDDRHARLRSAVLAELDRLSRIVDEGGPGGERLADVTALLQETGALHRARGMEVRVRTRPGLSAQIPENVLRRVLANLIRNVEVHARGATVELRGRREGTIVVVEVRDDGPGAPVGREEAVLEAGTRDADHGGSGLGLSISRELLAEYGGTLMIEPPAKGRRGFVVVLTLIAAAAVPSCGPLRREDPPPSARSA
jgi:two-component system OmpR family sensor kinase